MPILNYSTQIEPARSALQIQELLGKKGAKSVSVQYEKGEATAIFFSIDVHGQPINFRLPSNWQGVHAVMKADRKLGWKMKAPEQAKRVAWRIVKDWVEAQLAIIESGQAEMAEVFLPYAVTFSGETFYERLNHNPQLLLGAP